VAAVAGIATLPVACGSKEPPQNPQPFTPGQDAGAYPTGTATTTAYPTATTTATTTATAYPTATATATTTATATPTATAGVFDPAVQQLLMTQLAPIAAQDAKYMKKDGEMLSGVLQEGQTIERMAMMQPGKCYTVVGLGLPMIQELDIMIVPLIPIPNAPNIPMAQDMKTGAQATVAPAPDCYKYALPLPAQVKIIVKATKGSGAVGAQLYSK
jgi:hypothetical protein